MLLPSRPRQLPKQEGETHDDYHAGANERTHLGHHDDTYRRRRPFYERGFYRRLIVCGRRYGLTVFVFSPEDIDGLSPESPVTFMNRR
ncbi:hypothetical protein [Paenibacillus silviterrae]|uniref:hypothetical protein n=1 Tax=Paenibacillus silviterrae TaxID=3242194 RepID=UPI002543B604|nr:hypothetical protein [Paenibacillus chinjuensis]